MPQRPQEIRIKKFFKGEVIHGELKHANNKPAFILVQGCMVVPLNCVKELVTKDVVNSSLVGDNQPLPKAMQPSKNPKVMFADGVIIGAILGAAGAWFGEKKGWIHNPDKMNKVYGAVIGAVIGVYIAYRIKNSKPSKKTQE
jgi:ABC-type enterobactin transport system permease subunit